MIQYPQFDMFSQGAEATPSRFRTVEGVVLGRIDPDLCTLTYFSNGGKANQKYIPIDCMNFLIKIISEYGQEIPQSQTADKPLGPQGRATCIFICDDTGRSDHR